jgi:Spy/CpxP family protein refolding chaperone
MRRRAMMAAVIATIVGSAAASAQEIGNDRETMRTRREERRAARATAAQPPLSQDRAANRALAERTRIEARLRQALARVVRQRLNLNDEQTTRLIEVNRRFSDDRIRLARDEVRIRRELRAALASGDSSRSPNTARLLDQLLETQRQRLELQQKEQSALSEFLTPEQRARYIGMMDQLRRRIQQRTDSLRRDGLAPPE